LNCKPDPVSYDWTECGVVGPAYNQGQCGANWDISVVATVESYYAVKTGKWVRLSAQQPLDCNGQQGCEGGLPETAWNYIEEFGLEPDSVYPYTAEDGTCKYNQNSVVVTVAYFYNISTEAGLYKQLSTPSIHDGGPISVCVDASTWSNYNGGVITTCGTNIDHCVVLLGYNGYGQRGGYWILQNTWGSDWGINGNIYIEIGRDLCGIADMAYACSVELV